MSLFDGIAMRVDMMQFKLFTWRGTVQHNPLYTFAIAIASLHPIPAHRVISTITILREILSFGWKFELRSLCFELICIKISNTCDDALLVPDVFLLGG